MTEMTSLIVPSSLAIRLRPATEDLNYTILDLNIYLTLLKHSRTEGAIKVTITNVHKKAKALVAAAHTIACEVARAKRRVSQDRHRADLMVNALAVALDKYEHFLGVLEVMKMVSRRVEMFPGSALQMGQFQKTSGRKRAHSEFMEY